LQRYEAAPSARALRRLRPGGLRPGRRATPDVSLDADPASGVSVYDSTPYQQQQGWFTVGGTSASSPMWRALADSAGVDAAYVYGNAIPFRDIVSGNNGAPCWPATTSAAARQLGHGNRPRADTRLHDCAKSLTAGAVEHDHRPAPERLRRALNAAADLTVSLSSPATGTSRLRHRHDRCGTSTSPDFFYSDTHPASRF